MCIDRTRLQVIRADELVNRTLDRVEETGELVHKTWCLRCDRYPDWFKELPQDWNSAWHGDGAGITACACRRTRCLSKVGDYERTAELSAASFVSLLHDPAAAHHDVSVIKHRSLAGRDGALRLVEGHQHFIGA